MNIDISRFKYISPRAPLELQSYLSQKGYHLVDVPLCSEVASPLADHPDIQMCRLGISCDAPIVFAEQGELGSIYPADVAFNACCTGKYFIHNLKCTNPRLLAAAQSAVTHAGAAQSAKAEVEALTEQPSRLTFVDVKQGYCRCSCIPVSEDSIITYDRGIAAACTSAGMDVLVVEPGHVRLDGYDTGFIGGCTGVLEDADVLEISAVSEDNSLAAGTIVFNGDLSQHPDFARIVSFIEAHGKKAVWFEGWELTDIGSII